MRGYGFEVSEIKDFFFMCGLYLFLRVNVCMEIFLFIFSVLIYYVVNFWFFSLGGGRKLRKKF